VHGEQDHTPFAYRVRTAEPSDDAALRAEIGATLAHPDKQGKRESYRGAAGRGDLLVLERYDRQGHAWHVAGFVECHMRVDEYLSIRDVGTHGDEPQSAVVRYLLEQAFDSFRPLAAQVKIRRDAGVWLDIFRGIPGWFLEGEEYRRPHYWTIWRWDREHVQAAQQASRGPEQRAASAPRDRVARAPLAPAPMRGRLAHGPLARDPMRGPLALARLVRAPLKAGRPATARVHPAPAPTATADGRHLPVDLARPSGGQARVALAKFSPATHARRVFVRPVWRTTSEGSPRL
jgi:hypothetical protein